MPNKERSEKYIPLFPLLGKGGKMDFKEQYFDAWQEAWRFHKKFYDNDGSDKTWEQIVNESSETVRKYMGRSQYDFMKDLILAIISEIERVDKLQRKGKENEKKIQGCVSECAGGIKDN